LSTLQKIDLTRYQLKDEIVHAKPSLFDADDDDHFVNVYDPHIMEISRDLDPSQEEAFSHALTNKLAIIQGPPGECEILHTKLS
jgi:hypothetical protein